MSHILGKSVTKTSKHLLIREQFLPDCDVVLKLLLDFFHRCLVIKYEFCILLFLGKVISTTTISLSCERGISAAKFPWMKDCRETSLKQFSRENGKLKKPAENFGNLFVLFFVFRFQVLELDSVQF